MSEAYPKWMDCSPEMPESYQDLMMRAKDRWKKMDEQREEIIEAFMAKYHVDPADCIQVITCSEDGERKFAVRQQTQEEKEMIRKARVE